MKREQLMTLPPEIGNRYVFKQGGKPHDMPLIIGECEIVKKAEGALPGGEECLIYRGVPVNGSKGNSWWYWPDGKALLGSSYISILIADVPVFDKLPENLEFNELRKNREKMMARLKELNA